ISIELKSLLLLHSFEAARKKKSCFNGHMAEAPQGTVTFLFTDIAGSTRLWEKSPDQMRVLLARHDAPVRQAAEAHGGHVFKTVGDAFYVAFQTPLAALQAAIQTQRGLAAENWG